MKSIEKFPHTPIEYEHTITRTGMYYLFIVSCRDDQMKLDGTVTFMNPVRFFLSNSLRIVWTYRWREIRIITCKFLNFFLNEIKKVLFRFSNTLLWIFNHLVIFYDQKL